MPRQNRVTPFGEIIATEARGTFMGNRGQLHNERGEIRRPYQVQRWIICLLEFKNWWRPVMTPGFYTELFFLDEATALTAGHRPCAECRRADFNTFRQLWAAANPGLAGGPKPLVDIIDAALHRERMTATKQKVTYREQLSRLPKGTFITLPDDKQPYLVLDDKLLSWQPGGYGPARPLSAKAIVDVLTPRSIVRTLEQGYPAAIHASAFQGN